MKLIFTKNSNNEIDIQLQNGTVTEDFSYTEMVRQLLMQNVLVDTEFNNLTEEEEDKIQAMLNKISMVFQNNIENDDVMELM